MDFFDERILAALRDGEHRSFNALLSQAGFSHNTLQQHLRRLTVQGLVLREKETANGFGRPKFVYHIPSSTLLWNYHTSAVVYSSPAVVNGVVYIGSGDDKVYALNATNRIQLWSYITGGAVWLSPAVANGVVYVVSFSPTSSNTLSIIIGAVVAVVIIATLVFLMFRKRLKTKPKSPPSPTQNSSSVSSVPISQRQFRNQDSSGRVCCSFLSTASST